MGADDGHRRLTRVRDGRAWRIGGSADVAWIRDGTSITTAITAAIPPVFDAYATVELPYPQSDTHGMWSDEQRRHDGALLAVLSRHAPPGQWWLGYLDTGADDLVFPDAPPVTLYAHWPYVLVEAGPQQAAAWRREDPLSFWMGALPNLMFPADRSWLVSTLWDDDWTCVGGPATLVDDLSADSELGPRTRRVGLAEDAAPPGHRAR
jgi:hypothetical protein